MKTTLSTTDFPDFIQKSFQDSNLEDAEQKIKNNFEKGIISENLFCESMDLLNSLEKGKKATVGEIREWSGKKYQKTESGWIPATDHSSKTDQELIDEIKRSPLPIRIKLRAELERRKNPLKELPSHKKDQKVVQNKSNLNVEITRDNLKDVFKHTYPKLPLKQLLSKDVVQYRTNHKIHDDIEKTLPKKHVLIKDLIPTQNVVTAGNLDRAKNSTDLPLIEERDGKLYIIDGHHRIINAMLDKQREIEVAYIK